MTTKTYFRVLMVAMAVAGLILIAIFGTHQLSHHAAAPAPQATHTFTIPAGPVPNSSKTPETPAVSATPEPAYYELIRAALNSYASQAPGHLGRNQPTAIFLGDLSNKGSADYDKMDPAAASYSTPDDQPVRYSFDTWAVADTGAVSTDLYTGPGTTPTDPMITAADIETYNSDLQTLVTAVHAPQADYTALKVAS